MNPDLPFLEDFPRLRMFQPKRGEVLRCEACQCTWENSLTCWLCGAAGVTLTDLARLKMYRALHPAEDQVSA